MPELGASLPAAVREKARVERIAGVPALVVHPDFEGTPAPFLVWMHGRTANKELDPGRYLRLVRAGIATVALDLPGHGERHDDALQQPERTLEVVEQMANEVDRVVDALSSRPEFDAGRAAIGGMSAGGMAALVRLCRAHAFRAATVECTTGSLSWQRHRAMFDPARAMRLDPVRNLDGWIPLPLLVLHNELDNWIAADGQREFIESLAARTRRSDLIESHFYPETGAPHEHSGFGRFAADAKDRQTAFLVKHLRDG